MKAADIVQPPLKAMASPLYLPVRRITGELNFIAELMLPFGRGLHDYRA